MGSLGGSLGTAGVERVKEEEPFTAGGRSEQHSSDITKSHKTDILQALCFKAALKLVDFHSVSDERAIFEQWVALSALACLTSFDSKI